MSVWSKTNGLWLYCWNPFCMVLTNKKLPGRKKVNPSTIPPKPNWCKDLCRCDGRWGGYGMGGGCNVVMSLVASHSSKGGQYWKGQVPPISSSLGWMLQQVPLEALCSFFSCFMGGIHLTEPMAWDMIGTRTALAPFHHSKHCPCRQRLSFCYYSSACVSFMSFSYHQGRLLPTRTWNHGDWCRDTLRGTSAPLEEEHRGCPNAMHSGNFCPGCCTKQFL